MCGTNPSRTPASWLSRSVAVRDDYPELFPAVHRALFALRHDEAKQLNDRSEIARVLADRGR
jgi:hypothetical protein